MADTIYDGHVHVYFANDPLEGGDAGMEFNDALENAKLNGVTHVVTVMHNALGGFVDYVQDNGLDPTAIFHEIDGVQVSFGAEVTCRDFENPNEKGNPTKMHLLIVGPKLTPDSPIVKLLEMKAENDRLVDFGLVSYIAAARGIDLDPAVVKQYVLDKAETKPGFTTIGRKYIEDFFVSNGYDLALSNKQLNDLIEEAPKMTRMNLDMRDVIKVAHASGAMVIFAHPGVNLRRTATPEETVRGFLVAEGDGFESFYPASTPRYNTMVKNIVHAIRPRNRILFTPGSDAHSISEDSAIGLVKGDRIARNGQQRILRELDSVQDARDEGRLTSRIYRPVSPVEVAGIIEKYRVMSDSYKESYNRAFAEFAGQHGVLETFTLLDSDPEPTADASIPVSEQINIDSILSDTPEEPAESSDVPENDDDVM